MDFLEILNGQNVSINPVSICVFIAVIYMLGRLARLEKIFAVQTEKIVALVEKLNEIKHAVNNLSMKFDYVNKDNVRDFYAARRVARLSKED